MAKSRVLNNKKNRIKPSSVSLYQRDLWSRYLSSLSQLLSSPLQLPTSALHLSYLPLKQKIIFCSILFILFYLQSVLVPFRGDYVNLRRMPEWRDTLRRNRLFHFDRYVVFADVVNEMSKPNGKVERRMMQGFDTNNSSLTRCLWMT